MGATDGGVEQLTAAHTHAMRLFEPTYVNAFPALDILLGGRAHPSEVEVRPIPPTDLLLRNRKEVKHIEALDPILEHALGGTLDGLEMLSHAHDLEIVDGRKNEQGGSNGPGFSRASAPVQALVAAP